MASNHSQGNILLVDDEPLVTDALSRHFAKQGFNIVKCITAQEAIEILEQQPVDVVVSDERMPGMSGSELLGVVRRRFPNTIRIILSGHANLDAAVRAINEGEVYRFILKPCHPGELIQTIQQALQQKRLEARSRELLREFRKQAEALDQLERSSPGLLSMQVDESGALLVDESDADEDVDMLLREIEQAMALTRQRKTGAG